MQRLDGGEIEISQRSDLDRARRIAYILSQAAATRAADRAMLADAFSAAGRTLLAFGGCSLVFWLGKGMIKIITMEARDMAEAW